MALLFVGCNREVPKAPALPDGEPSALTRVQLQLNWLPDAQHGGFYAAVANGDYAAAGLDVQILPGGPGTAVLPKLAIGQCDFAIANADQVLLARAQDADIVAVFAAMQDSPRCIMVHKDSGITDLKDLSNMTLALGDGKAFAEYLKSRIPLSGVRVVSYSGTIAKFMVDDNFAQQGYVFSEPIMAESAGGDPLALMVSDTGFNPYSSVVVTRKELWQKDPELVTKFVNATRAGWEAYLESPDTANEAIAGHYQDGELTTDVLAKSADAIRKLCKPTPETEIGTMKLKRWETLRSQLVELKLIPKDSSTAAAAFVKLP